MPTFDLPDLGPCCCCGTTRRVRNVVMLPRRAPAPGSGWGCLQCGLPPDGAIYVACDRCVRSRCDPVEVCAGMAAEGGRVPIGSLPPGEFDHDLSRHPECTAVEADL